MNSTSLWRTRVRQDFDRAAVQYDHFGILQKEIADMLAQRAMNYLAESAMLLDAGAGTGLAVESLQQRGWKGNAIAFDLAPEMCRQALERRKLPAVSGNMEALPFRDGIFSGYISSLAWQWLEDTEEAVREALRVLKPDAKAIVATFGDKNLEEMRQTFYGAGVKPAPMHDFLSADALVKAAKAAGAGKVEIERVMLQKEHADVAELFRSITRVGGGYKGDGPGLSRSAREKVEALYPKAEPGKTGITATWEALFLVFSR